MNSRRRLVLAGLGALIAAHPQPLWPSQAAIEAAQHPDTILLMRHALAPGGGDPPGFRLGACSTQRNLSDAGRRQARDIGARLHAAGIRPGLVAASQWCRCTQTAQLLDLGAVTPWPSLNSFFDDATQGPGQTAQTLAQIQALGPNLRPLLVTHQVNIRGLTGQNTRSGEIIVAHNTPTGGLQAVGAIAPPQAA